MSWPRRLLRWGLILGAAGILLSIAAVGIAYWLISPRLPNVAEIRDIRLQVPLKVLSLDGKLIAVFGETRRTPVRFAQIPERVRNAFVAIEDARFYEHPGIDVVGIGRAVWLLATSDRERVPGGSTITQQVARNFFLSPEYSFSRKISEIFLALKMERELTKDEILSLYINTIYYGHSRYGVEEASLFYFGKHAKDLSVGEAAVIAGDVQFTFVSLPSAKSLIGNDKVRLLDALSELKRIRDFEGRRRQLQFVGKLMRTLDPAMHEAMREQLAAQRARRLLCRAAPRIFRAAAAGRSR